MFNTYAHLMALLVSMWSKLYLKQALLFRLGLTSALCFMILASVHAFPIHTASPDPWP